MSAFTVSESNISELERKALEIIKERGDEGIYQYELWRRLGLDSRDGSRLAQRLLRKGLITREPVTHNGRRTYLLKYLKKEPKPIEVEVDLGSFMEIPCFTCRFLDRCHRGGIRDPTRCRIIRDWVEAKLREKIKTAANTV